MSPARAIAWGALTVGLLDGLDAVVFFGLRGVSPLRVFQAIAAGLLGRAAFRGGAATAVLGAMLHFSIALAIVATYYLVSHRVPTLTRRPLVWGPVYGVVVYLTMNLVVVPLSAVVNASPSLPVVVNGGARRASRAIILGGFGLLGLCLLAGRLIGGTSTEATVTAAKVFIPIWFVAALVNLWVGVGRAGYSVAEELPIFLVIFAIPAAVALLISRKLS